MAIATQVLQTQIENAFKANVPNATATQTAQITALAASLATAFDTWIKTATVTTPLGIPVQVVPATGTGSTTVPAIGVIS